MSEVTPPDCDRDRAMGTIERSLEEPPRIGPESLPIEIINMILLYGFYSSNVNPGRTFLSSSSPFLVASVPFPPVSLKFGPTS